MAAGTCSSLTPALSTLPKTDVRTDLGLTGIFSRDFFPGIFSCPDTSGRQSSDPLEKANSYHQRSAVLRRTLQPSGETYRRPVAHRVVTHAGMKTTFLIVDETAPTLSALLIELLAWIRRLIGARLS